MSCSRLTLLPLLLVPMLAVSCGEKQNTTPVEPASTPIETAGTGAPIASTSAEEPVAATTTEKPVAPPLPPAPVASDAAGTPKPDAPVAETPQTATTGTDAPKPETKPEADANGRRATKEADAAVHRYGKLLRLPTTGVKTFEARLRSAMPQFGGATIEANPTWSAEDGLKLNVELNDEFLKATGLQKEQAGFISVVLEGQFTMFFSSLFESLESTLPRYHSAHKTTEEGLRVELLPIGPEGIGWERQKCYFGDDGLMLHMVGIRHYANPADPNVAALIGTEEDFEFEYIDLSGGKAISKVNVGTNMANGSVTFEYFDVETQAALPKTVTITTTMSPMPIEVHMSDIKLDGKLIAATVAKKPDAGADVKVDGVDKDGAEGGGEDDDGEDEDDGDGMR